MYGVADTSLPAASALAGGVVRPVQAGEDGEHGALEVGEEVVDDLALLRRQRNRRRKPTEQTNAAALPATISLTGRGVGCHGTDDCWSDVSVLLVELGVVDDVLCTKVVAGSVDFASFFLELVLDLELGLEVELASVEV